MTYGSLAEMDEADERAERRAAARAQVRGDQPAEPTPPTTGTTPVPMPTVSRSVPGPRPVPMPTTSRKPTDPPPVPMPTVPTLSAMPATKTPATAKPSAFELVGALPGAKGRPVSQIPAIRQQLIDFAKAHSGEWIRYRSTDADSFKDPSSFANRVRKGQGGFGDGFEAAVRVAELYIRYVGTTEEVEA